MQPAAATTAARLYSTGEHCHECGGTGRRGGQPELYKPPACTHCGGWGYRIRSEPMDAEQRALAQHADTVRQVEALLSGPVLWRPASPGLLQTAPDLGRLLHAARAVVRIDALGGWCRLMECRPAGLIVYYRAP